MSIREKARTALIAAAAAGLVSVPGYAQSLDPIQDLALYNTGVDAMGNALEAGAADPHYVVPLNPHNPESDTAYVPAAIPAPPWILNTPQSQWIAPNPVAADIAPGLYAYRTTFDLGLLDPNLAYIRGAWAADDSGQQILVNGLPLGTASWQSPGFGGLRSFWVGNHLLQPGVNTIEFRANNGGNAPNPGGLHVQFTEARMLPSQGALLTDSFDYSTGPLTPNGGGSGWRSNWTNLTTGTFGSAVVASPGLSYPGIESQGNTAHAKFSAQGGSSQSYRLIDVDAFPGHLRDADGNIGSPGESVWFAVLGQRNSASPTGFNGVATFMLTGNVDPDNFDPNVATRTERTFVGVATNSTDWRLGGAQAVTTGITPANSVAGDPNFGVDLLVVRVDFRRDPADPDSPHDRALMWVNPLLTGAAPDDATAAAVQLAPTSNPFLHFNAIRIAGNDALGGFYDEFKLGTGFDFVTSVPSEWASAAGGAYSVSGNWTQAVPQGAGIVAKFGGALTSSGTVNVDAPQTLGGIAFQNAEAGYTLAGSAITLDRPRGRVGLAGYGGDHTISAPLNLSKDAEVTVTSGSVSAENLNAAGVNLAKYGAGTFRANHIRAASLSVQAGVVQVIPGGTAAATSRVNALAIAPAGSVDLTNNAMIVDYSDASPLSAIAQMVRNGQIVSSLGDSRHGIGYADNAAFNKSSFAGQGVDSSSILIGYTLLGDANLDGVVDSVDLSLLLSSFGRSANVFWQHGDFTHSGSVASADLSLLLTNFGRTLDGGAVTLTAADWALYEQAMTLIPEPGLAGVLSFGLLGLLARRRRR